jgi:AsmA family protein
MQRSSMRRFGWIAAAAVLSLIAGGAALLAALDAGYARAALIRYCEAHFNRHIRIEGPLHLNLWSHEPRLVAEQVIIGNPSWAPPGEMGRVGRLTLKFGAPRFTRLPSLESVTLEEATLNLVRDDAGRANWHRIEPVAPGAGLPLIRELTAEHVHMTLNDARRHLKFDGTVSALARRQTPSQPLHIEGNGQLNGKSMSFSLEGDPLDTTRSDHPYAWRFSEDSSGSRVSVHGSLPQPYSFDLVDAAFETTGENLRDLYFLTGVTLINTGAYRLSGNVERRGDDSRFTELQLHTGQSDVEGTLSITLLGGRSQLAAELSAKLLRTTDFGARAAGHAAPADATPRMFSDATFNPDALRRTDTKLRLSAQQVQIGRTLLQSLAGEMKIDHGIVTAAPLHASLLQGRVEAEIRLDANEDTPPVHANLHFSDLQLAALNRKDGEAPAEGLLQAHVDINGKGRSVREVAGSANGTVTATLPKGTIRASLAELAGVDLRGLGLTLTHDKREVAVRCAAAAFKANEGTLATRALVIDTLPVVIRGEGEIRLGSEELDLTLRGQPKDVRLLRLDAPLLVRGTLVQPSIAIQTHDSKMKLIDPGHGKDVDCAELLAASRAAEARAEASEPSAR